VTIAKKDHKSYGSLTKFALFWQVEADTTEEEFEDTKGA